METQQAKPGAIFAAIPRVMTDIDAIGKNRKNIQQDFKFRGIDDVYNEVQKIMAKHGVFTVPEVVNRVYTSRQTAKGSLMMERILTIKYRFYASDGSFVEAVVDGEAMDTGDKTSNKSMSVAHKYALLQVFCIPTEDDKDPDSKSPRPVAPAVRPNASDTKKPDVTQASATKDLADAHEVTANRAKVGADIVKAAEALGLLPQVVQKMAVEGTDKKTSKELSLAELTKFRDRLMHEAGKLGVRA